MPRPMTRYKIEKSKVEKHSFKVSVGNFGHKEYHEYGRKKVYANKKQADNKVAELQSNGFACERSKKHPYCIILSEI